jgi:hypothetical protein
MERADATQPNDRVPVPATREWTLAARYDGSTGTVLRFNRTDSRGTVHSVTAKGVGYDEALVTARGRMQLFDESEAEFWMQ